jgi:hypothetical protein
MTGLSSRSPNGRAAASSGRRRKTMSENKVSQVREAQDAWKKMMGEHVARMEQVYAETARLQAQGLEQGQKAVDELARLSKDSFQYMGQLSAEWRKLTIEATKKTAELWAVEG